MKGFKAFNSDLTCRGVQFAVGGEFSINENPIPCERGFHFCKNISDVYKFYPMNDKTRICVVDAIGEVSTDDNVKFCTNRIVIEMEITSEIEKHCNADRTVNGYCNTGYCNTGDRNTGNRNTGDRNTGNRNTGDWNIGYWNTGYWNTGCHNTGDHNTGGWNTGDWNTGNRNTGCFCVEDSKMYFFDKPTELSMNFWKNSKARLVMSKKPSLEVEWIAEDEMTEEEKNKSETYKTTGGFLRVIDGNELSQKWWDELCDSDKHAVMSLPNFDAEKFYKCTGIKVNENANNE